MPMKKTLKWLWKYARLIGLVLLAQLINLIAIAESSWSHNWFFFVNVITTLGISGVIYWIGHMRGVHDGFDQAEEILESIVKGELEARATLRQAVSSNMPRSIN